MLNAFQKRLTFKEFLLIAGVLLTILSMAFFDIFFLNKTLKTTTGNPQALRTGPYGQEHNRPHYFSVQSTDNCFTEEHLQHFIKSSLQDKIFPLWNPHQLCGYALIGMMHIGLFWPLNFLHYLLPDPYMWDAMILTRLLLAGIFMFVYLRTLRLLTWPSLAGAIAYMLSGPFVLAQWNFANVELLVPLALTMVEKILRCPNSKTASAFGLTIGLMMLAGHPEHILLDNLFIFSYFLFRLFTVIPRAKPFPTLVHLVFGYGLGVGLGALVLLPFLQNWFTELWNFHPKSMGQQTDGAGILQSSLINLLMPTFFQPGPVSGNFVRTTFWGHLGVVPVLLAACGFLTSQRRGLNRFIAVFTFIIFCKSYFNLPWINWIGQLPIVQYYNFFHHSQHLFACGIAILVGLGTRTLSLHPTPKKILFFPSGILLGVILGCLIVYHQASFFSLSLTAAGIAGVSLMSLYGILKLKISAFWRTFLIALLTAGELMILVPHEHVQRFHSYPEVPYLTLLKNVDSHPWRAYGTFATFYPNTATGYRVDDFGGEDAILPRRYVQFINHFIVPHYFEEKMATSFNFLPLHFNPEVRPYLSMLNVKYMIAPLGLNLLINHPYLRHQTASIMYQKEAIVILNGRAFPRTYIVHRAVFAANEDRTVELMKKYRDHLAEVAVLQHPPVREIVEANLKAPTSFDSTAEIITSTPNQVQITANLVAPGLLVLSDSYHSDWEVYVDGKKDKIYLTDFLVRSVFLPAGTHQIKFCFVPKFFYFGIGISGLTALLMLYLVFRRERPPKKSLAF